MRCRDVSDSVPGGVVLEEVPCPCGCPPGDEVVLSGCDRLHGLAGRFSVVRCRNCGLKRTNPRPNPASIGFYYPPDYDPYEKTRVTGSPAPAQGLKGVARRLFDSRSTKLPEVKPRKMLEIGCASGAYLNLMAERGWEVQGLEPSPVAAGYSRSRGFEVLNSDLESAWFPTRSFDLIVGWMVLEHLHSPVECLNKMKDWLRPGGWLVFSVPNAGSYEWGLFRDRWFALQLPTHLFHYDRHSIKTVLACAGWNLERVFFQRNNSNLVYSLGYGFQDLGLSRLGDYLAAGPLCENVPFRVLTYPYAWLAAQLKTAGRMTVWARKA